MASSREPGSVWRLRADVASARVLIWVGTVGRAAAVSPAAHVYLADRYQRLAHEYLVRGRYLKARRFARLASEHYRAGGGDGPPFAAAMAMPRPRQWVIVNAVSRHGLSSSDVA